MSASTVDLQLPVVRDETEIIDRWKRAPQEIGEFGCHRDFTRLHRQLLFK